MSQFRVPGIVTNNKTLQILIIAALYFFAAHIGLLLAYKNSNASPVWPPSGLALATLILLGYRTWPGVFIGAFVANMQVFAVNHAATLPVIAGDSFVIACGNTTEALVGVYLFSKWIGVEPLLGKYGKVFMFVAVALLVCLISSLTGAVMLGISNIVPWAIVQEVWRTWYLGDVSGMLIFTPFILVWSRPGDNVDRPAGAFVELIINFLLLLVASDLVFLQVFFSPQDHRDVLQLPTYIFLPLLLWTAFRQNSRAVITALTMVSTLAVIGTINLHGSFSGGTINQALIALELFVSVIMVSFMALSALLTEQRRAACALLENKDNLEERVSARTSELKNLNRRLLHEINEHEKTELKLLNVQEDFIEACKIANLGHWQWDIPANVITWSTELIAIFDLDPKLFHATYDGYLQQVHPEDRALVDNTVKESFKTGSPFQFYHRIIRSGGDCRWLYSNGRVIADAAGNPVKMLGTAQDVTEIKEKETLSSYVTGVVEYSADAIYTRSRDGLITSWNKSAERIFGYTKAEAIGQSVIMLCPPDRVKETEEIVEKLNRGETLMHYETVRISKDGCLVDISLTASPMIDISGNVIGASHIARDITQQKKQEDARFRLIVESAPNAMVLVNKEGKIEIINSQTEKLFGYARNELLGKNIEMLLPERFRGKHPGYRSSFFANPEARAMGVGRELYALNRKGEEIPVEIGLNPIETQDGMMVLAAVIDISERKKMEEASRGKQVAEESVKMKDHFLANMSHEVRTPMNAIIGFTDLLENTPLNAEQKQFVTAVKSSGQNLLTIINDILDFSKIEAGKLELEHVPMNIADLLASLNEVTRLKAQEKGVELIFDYYKNQNYLVLGDPTRLTQVLMNLLSNAIKFTESGSVLMQMYVLEENDDSYTFAFRVKDTGMGIFPDKLETIFERFTQATSDTTRKYGGTGLGLSIVRSLVELHNGRITVSSRVGEGSEFVVIIEYPKLKDTHEYAPQVELTLTETSSLGHLNVLVAEDNAMNQKLVLTVLRNFGFTVDIAENGEIAMEKVAANYYDLVLMDIQMPVKDGYAATVYIRTKLHSNIPIIAMTAHAMTGEREKCIQLGMNEYISKPFKTAELLHRIAEVVSKTNIKSTPAKGIAIEIPENMENSNITNFAYLNEMSNGNKAFIKEMVMMFNQQVPVEIEKLEKAVTTGDYTGIKNVAHKLKSSAALIGMDRIARVLAILQEMGSKQGDLYEIKVHFNDVKTSCAKAYIELEKYLEDNAG